MATEIDHPWSYIGGTRDLVDGIIEHPDLETVPVEHTDHW